MVTQRDRPALLDHELAAASDQVQPGPEVLRVRHGRRQRGHPDIARQLDDDLLPDRPPLTIGQVVHLVEYDVAQALEDLVVLVDHVAEHLCGHHHDRRTAVDRPVTGEQSDLFLPVATA